MGTNDGKKKNQSSNPQDSQTTEDFHKAITKSVSIKKTKKNSNSVTITWTKNKEAVVYEIRCGSKKIGESYYIPAEKLKTTVSKPYKKIKVRVIASDGSKSGWTTVKL